MNPTDTRNTTIIINLFLYDICPVLQIFVLYFYVLHFGASISCPFHIDNLDVNCSALLTDYLLANDIQVISCHSSKSWLRSREERELATAFRVCVRADDEQKVFDPDLWAKGVIIRRWQFTKSRNGRQQ